jgi:di/tripeptidase
VRARGEASGERKRGTRRTFLIGVDHKASAKTMRTRLLLPKP